MRRRYILLDLKVLNPPDVPEDNWFRVLADWESARWARDAARLGELWEAVRGSGDEGIIRGFRALRRQLPPWLRIPDSEPGEDESRGRRKTMMRYEETWLAENLRKRDEELRREGHEDGRRSLLRQLALQQFGPGGVAQLAEVLDEVLDERAGSDRDGALARAIIECDTVAEVVARARGL